jgi:hypothetical protein
MRPHLLVAPQVTVTTPAAGETLALDGSVLQIVFHVKNVAAGTSLSFRPELWRNGALLGPIFGTGFALNPASDPGVVGVQRGHYIAGTSGALAASGGGYQYRIVVYEGTWGQGHKVVASGLSPTFAFGAAPALAGPPTITVATPAAGTSFPLDGGIIQIQFSAKNFDPNKQYSYRPELWRNGARFGAIFGTGFVLNTKVDSQVVGVTRGHYLAGSSDALAAPGGGYQYRIRVYEGTSEDTPVASGTSAAFAFAPPPALAGRPAVTVATPAAGATFPLDGGIVQIQFGAKNFDPNQQFSYRPELWRNGALLGPIFGSGFVLNTKVDSQVVGVGRGRYLAGGAEHTAPAGGGYQYRIVVYQGVWGQGHTVITSGASGTFAFSP